MSNLELDIKNAVAVSKDKGESYDIVHWGTRFTTSIPYKKVMVDLETELNCETTYKITIKDYLQEISKKSNTIVLLPKRIVRKIKRILSNI